MAGWSDKPEHDGEEPTAIATPRMKHATRRGHDPLAMPTPPPLTLPAFAIIDDDDEANFDGDDPPTTAEPLGDHHLRLMSPHDDAFVDDVHSTMIDSELRGERPKPSLDPLARSDENRRTVDLGPAAHDVLNAPRLVGKTLLDPPRSSGLMPEVRGSEEQVTMPVSPAAINAKQAQVQPTPLLDPHARIDDSSRTVRWEAPRSSAPGSTPPSSHDAAADREREQALSEQPTRMSPPRVSGPSGSHRAAPSTSSPPMPRSSPSSSPPPIPRSSRSPSPAPPMRASMSPPPPFAATSRSTAPTAPPPFRGAQPLPQPGSPMPLPSPAQGQNLPQQYAPPYPAPFPFGPAHHPPPPSFGAQPHPSPYEHPPYAQAPDPNFVPSQYPQQPHPMSGDPMRAISMKTPQDEEAKQPRAIPRVRLRAMAEVAQTPRHGMGHLAPPHDPRDARSRRLQDLVIWGSVVVITASLVTLVIWFLAR